MKNTGLYAGIVLLLVITASLAIYKTSIVKPPGNNELTAGSSVDQDIVPTDPNNAGTPTISDSVSPSPMVGTTVVVESVGFQPNIITINAGDRVTWINKTGAEISVNSELHPTHLIYPALNIGRIADGEMGSLIFDQAGTYQYHDHLNPTRTGTIIVN